MKKALCPLYKLNITRGCQHENIFTQVYYSVPGCQTCMCKRSIRYLCILQRPFVPQFDRVISQSWNDFIVIVLKAIHSFAVVTPAHDSLQLVTSATPIQLNFLNTKF